MPQIKDNQGASNTLFNHSRPNNPKTSDFDYSAQNNFTADVGMIIPFDYFPTLPGEDIDIDFEMILDTLPLLLPSITQYKVVTHWYYMKRRDMWKGWKTFSTKGRTGNIDKLIPRIDLNYGAFGDKKDFSSSDFDDINFFVPTTQDDFPIDSTDNVKILFNTYHSLSAFLGVPPSVNGLINFIDSQNQNVIKHYLPYAFVPDSFDNSSSIDFENDDGGTDTYYGSSMKIIQTGHNQYRFVNALPFVMYQSIVKHNYVNQNLLQSNTALFPEQGDDDWILPYNASHNGINYIGLGEVSNSDVNDDNCSPSGVFSSSDARVRLDMLRYAQYQEDYFTTSLPWLQRGDSSTLEFDLNEDDSLVKLFGRDLDGNFTSDTFISNLVNGDVEFVKPHTTSNSGLDGFKIDTEHIQIVSQNFNTSQALLASTRVGNSSIPAVIGKIAQLGISVNANQFRELFALSVWQERNARVNGSYNSMIYQHWLVNPHSEEHIPTYIGGTADFISFTSVLQNSETTTSSPLASQAGLGRVNGSSRVGHVRSDDYGYVMGIMIIYPVSTYSQGVSHDLACENVFDDFVQPEFEGLSPQPILNKELFISGSDSVDDNLFGYQERYTYLKVRQNQNKGMFYASPDKDRLFSAMVQSRWFNGLPELSYQFLCMSPNNVRRDWLAYPEYPAFRIQTATKAKLRGRRLSYTSQPNTFGF